MNNDTTRRTSGTSILMSIRNVNAAINALGLKKANQTYSAADARHEEQLYKKRDRLYKEMDAYRELQRSKS
jgi:hypothetical protein